MKKELKGWIKEERSRRLIPWCDLPLYLPPHLSVGLGALRIVLHSLGF